MAKARSNSKKIDKKIPKIIHVKSKTYGEHTRAERGTYTDITLADGMKVSSSHQTEANLMAKIIFDAVNEFAPRFKDGRFWSRLVSVFRQQKRMGIEYNYDFGGFEVREDYPLGQQGRFLLSDNGSQITVSYNLKTETGYHLSILRIAANETLLTPYPHEVLECVVKAGERTGVVPFDFTSLPEGTPVIYVLQCEQLKKGELVGVLDGKGVRFF